MTTLHTYIVTVIPARPAHDERGHEIEVAAKTAALAISQARKQVRWNCLYDRLDGALKYTAKRAA